MTIDDIVPGCSVGDLHDHATATLLASISLKVHSYVSIPISTTKQEAFEMIKLAIGKEVTPKHLYFIGEHFSMRTGKPTYLFMGCYDGRLISVTGVPQDA